jgi:zinc D-Ala-D-Ala carboxypeptidase
VALVRPRLAESLERLRATVGKPIPIVSGYRCPVHNHAVGGAPDSQHMYGSAADIPRGICTSSQATRAGFTGIGTKDGLPIHVDVRDGPLTTWKY